MRSLSALLAGAFVVLAAHMSAQDTPATTASPRLAKIATRSESGTILLDYIFDSDPSTKTSSLELRCVRQRKNQDVGSGPLTPNRLETKSGTTVTYKVVASDLDDVDALDCTLFDSSSPSGRTAVISSRLDLADRLERLHLTADMSRNEAELDRCRAGVGGSPTAPIWRDPALLPDITHLRFETAGCAQIQARIWNDTGYDKTSAPTRLGTTHDIPFKTVPPGLYNVQAWFVNPATREKVPNTLFARDDAFKARERADDIAFTKIEPRVIESGIRFLINTNVPALAGVEIREYDQEKGVAGKAATPDMIFAKDDNNMPRNAVETSFSIPVILPPGTYQYRVRAVNADGKEGATKWDERPAVTVPKPFGFASALQIAVTPVGIIMGWSATDKPDEVSLAIKDTSGVSTTTIKPSTKDISIGLGPDASTAYLQRVSKGETPILVAAMKRTVETARGMETREASHEVLVKLTTTPEQARATVASATFMSDDDKNKLVQIASDAVAGRRPKFNWKDVFQNAVQLLVKAVVH